MCLLVLFTLAQKFWYFTVLLFIDLYNCSLNH